ncbi:MAG: glycosyltransferase family 4 protein [Patescibacteria group bacterium]
MKILVATGIYPPDIGGPATYSKLLFDELPKRGIDVFVVSFGRVRKYPKIIRHSIYFFIVFVKAFSVDIIFAQDTVSVGFPSLCVAKILGKKFFVRVPGDYAWEQAVQRYGISDSIDEFQNKKYFRHVEFLRKVQKITVNNADKVITPSMYFKNLVSGWVKNRGKVFCIYNGIDFSDIPEPNNKYNSKTIISAGRLVPWKGFQTLIGMMRFLPDWKLFIAGDGPMKDELESTIIKDDVKDRVCLLGQIPRKELIEKIQKSDIFVLNTSFESFSFQIVEAMAVGTPVITTNIGNLAEIIDNERSGILIAPNDEQVIITNIKRLSYDLAFRNRIVVEAKEKVKIFSIENTLNSLIEQMQKP